MIRVLTPVTKNGSADTSRRVVHLGEAQLLTQVVALPITFEIEAGSLGEGLGGPGGAARERQYSTAVGAPRPP